LTTVGSIASAVIVTRRAKIVGHRIMNVPDPRGVARVARCL
jgi:hypothetical protein